MPRIRFFVLLSLLLSVSACSDKAERSSKDSDVAVDAGSEDSGVQTGGDIGVDASPHEDLGAAQDLGSHGDMSPMDAATTHDMSEPDGSKCVGWDVQSIFPIAGHDTTTSGGASSLTFDAAGAAHVSFSTNLGLYYGTNATGSWTFELIGSPRPVSATGISVTPQGRVDIVYYEQENFDVRQTTNATGDWVTTVIADEGIVGEDLVMAEDTQGNLHIAYLDGTRSTLVYGVRQGETWTLEDVQTNTPGRPVPAIALDGMTPLISFGNYSQGLRFASRATGSWVVEAVVDGFDVGGWSSLDKDGDGNLQISYQEFMVDASELHFVSNETGAWVSETLDTINNTGWNTALATQGGVTHITYGSTQPSGELRYAARDATGWTTTSISEMSGFSTTSMVFDTSGQLAVSFRRDQNSLALARCTP